MRVRIVIADDHEIVRDGLRHIIENQNGWQVIAEAEDGQEAIALAIEHEPDVIVMDCLMPRMNGIDATRHVRARCCKAQVLMFTMYNNEHMVREALLAGARGYLLKVDAKRRLIEAIETVASGRAYFSPCVSDLLLQNYQSHARCNGTLSPRERQVVQLIAEGLTNKHIAIHLDISLKTVETHRAAIMAKLRLGSCAELVRYAIRNQIVEA